MLRHLTKHILKFSLDGEVGVPRIVAITVPLAVNPRTNWDRALNMLAAAVFSREHHNEEAGDAGACAIRLHWFNIGTHQTTLRLPPRRPLRSAGCGAPCHRIVAKVQYCPAAPPQSGAALEA
jgi:hypothetical protein